jgi:hypothetical protein
VIVLHTPKMPEKPIVSPLAVFAESITARRLPGLPSSAHVVTVCGVEG